MPFPKLSMAGLRRVQSLASLALWLTGVVAFFADSPPLTALRIAILVLFLALGVAYAKPLTRVIGSIALVGLAAAAAQGHAGSALVGSLPLLLAFSMFLPALIFVRDTMLASPETEAAQQAFLRLGDRERTTGLTVGTHLLAGILVLGAVAVLAPFVARNEDAAERRRLGLALMRGFGLCFLWSPFTVGMGFALAYRPEVSGAVAVGTGAVVAFVAMLATIGAFEGLPALRRLPRAALAFRPLLGPVLVATCSVVLLSSLSGKGTLETTGVVIPLFCAARLASLGGHRLEGTLIETWRRLHSIANELLLFAGAVVIGRLIVESGLAVQLVDLLHLERLPLVLVPLVLMVTGALLACLGLHPIVIGNIVVALLAPFETRLPGLVQIHIILFIWLTGAIFSYSSLSVATAISLLRMRLADFVFGPNTAFAAAIACLLSLLALPWLWR